MKIGPLNLNKKHIKQYAPLAIIIVAVTISFIIGWYVDNSKPQGGDAWLDQKFYTFTTGRFLNNDLPLKAHLHYSIGYPLLGVVGAMVRLQDPFMFVSFALLISSAVLIYLSMQKILNTRWAILSVFLLFAWDFQGRTFQYASDLFSAAWNNQVLFFLFAFYLWLFALKSDKKPSIKLLIVTGVVSGITFLTREETLLFIVPALIGFLYITKSDWKRWLLVFSIVGLCYMPQVIIKQQVLGSVASSGRKSGYSKISEQYLRPDYLYRNVWETVIYSKYFNGPDPQRPALLQAAPWLIVSPIGIGIIIFSKRYPTGLKLYMIISCGLIIFYLAGANMSAPKLRYHCLRYIAPGFIALNIGTIIFAREAWHYSATKYKQLHEK